MVLTAGLDGYKILSHSGTRSPEGADRSESLYQLSYNGEGKVLLNRLKTSSYIVHKLK